MHSHSKNGAEQLTPYFTDIVMKKYPDALDVTEVEPLLAYILSMDAPGFREPDMTAALEQHIRRTMDQAGGVFHISKEVGAFITRNGK
ncbi:MAG TPA: hypothetical protein VF792_06190 [Ktedonobacterales bacterium]